MPAALSAKPLFEAMPYRVNKEAAKTANIIYQFNLEGEGRDSLL